MFNVNIAWEQSTNSVYLGNHIVKEKVYFEYNSNVDRTITDGLNKIYKYYYLLLPYKEQITASVDRAIKLQDYGNGRFYYMDEKNGQKYQTECEEETQAIFTIIRELGYTAGNFNNFQPKYLEMISGIYERACNNDWKYLKENVALYEDQARIFRLAYENIDEVLYKMSPEYINGEKAKMDFLFEKIENKMGYVKVLYR